ncbi:MAG: hypothetical protein Q9182_004105 [Xanthomendoza sp. 2 TL-2023]
MENTGTLLDLGEEDTAANAKMRKKMEAEKSAFEQLLDMDGFEMKTVTAATITTTTTTIITTTTVAKATKIAETKARSPTASSKSSTANSKSQLRTDGSRSMRDPYLWGTRSCDLEQATVSATNNPNVDLPIATAETSDDHDDGSSLMSTPFPALLDPNKYQAQISISRPQHCQPKVLPKKPVVRSTTSAPSLTFGPPNSARDTIVPLRTPWQKVTGNGKESETMPDKSNTIAKYNPFHSLWSNAPRTFDVKEGESLVRSWI